MTGSNALLNKLHTRTNCATTREGLGPAYAMALVVHKMQTRKGGFAQFVNEDLPSLDSCCNCLNKEMTAYSVVKSQHQSNRRRPINGGTRAPFITNVKHLAHSHHRHFFRTEVEPAQQPLPSVVVEASLACCTRREC